MSNLNGKVAIITGGGRGIGRAVAEHLMTLGASVTAVDNRAESIEGLTQTASKTFGENFFPMVENTATAQGVERIVEQTLQRYGRIDLLLNNASITRDSLFLRMEEKQWDEVLENNLKGPFLCCKAVAPIMREQGGGRVVNMVAASGATGNAGQANYAAAKGGVMALTWTLSQELSRYNITANAVIPAAWTEMSEIIPNEVLVKVVGEEMAQRLKTRKPHQVAPLVAYLASDAAANVTGQCFGIAGRELTVWGFMHPVFRAESKGEAWGPDELAEMVEQLSERPWQKPPSAFL